MAQTTRRNFMLTTALGGLAAGCATAQSPDLKTKQAPSPRDNFIVDVERTPDAVFEIWPDGTPEPPPVELSQHYVERDNAFDLPDRAVHEVTNPTLSLFEAANPNGTTMLIIPGGGYNHVVVEKEGFEGARFFNQFGYTVYVASHRLPHQGWKAGPDTPLQDAQRAIRTCRHLEERAGRAEQSILVMGFSAGGHVAGSVTERSDARVYDPRDQIDTLSARPDLTALIYPVVLMGSEFTHKGSQIRLLGTEPTSETLEKYSLTETPNPQSPPVFLMHTLDDPAVPYENSLMLSTAYRKAGVEACLHTFAKGGHGFGMRGIEKSPLRAWPQLLMEWERAHSETTP